MLALCFLLISADSDASMRELVARVKQNEDRLEADLENFGYNQKIDRTEGPKRTVEEYEVTNYKGRRIRRLLSRNGKPLAGAELEKENKRIEKLITKMEKGEIPALSNRRLRLEDLVAAASFLNVRNEQMSGREVVSFDFVPRPNYKAKNLNEKFIQNVSGRLWIDPKALQLTRVDFGVNSTFKVAGGLFFAMKPGTKFSDEQLWFDNRIWLPSVARVTFKAKAMMAKSLNIEGTTTHSQYRRFDVSATDKTVEKD
jgi:hypothetical protein